MGAAAAGAGRGVAVAWVPRVVTAVAVVVTGVAHAVLWADGMRAVALVGPGFLVNAVAGVVLGVLVLVWRSPWPLLGAAAFGAATLGAFVVATSPAGLLGVRSRWEGVPEWVCAVSEAVAVVAALVALRTERRATRG